MKSYFKFLCIAVIAVYILCSCVTAPQNEIPSANPESSSKPEESSEPETLSVNAPAYFYEFLEGVVKYSSIDPKSDFAKSAADFARAFLENEFSENENIESFEITDVEVDMNTTNWNINTWLYNSEIKSEDVLNNFLVVRFRSNIKAKEGTTPVSFLDHDWSEPLEGHLFLIYDPEDKYDLFFGTLPEYDWEIWNRNFWSWVDDYHTEERMFDVFYARKNEYLPIYTHIKENDGLALLAEEQVRTRLENELSSDPNILSYEIIDVEANINHTNWYINTLQYSDYDTGTLGGYILCVSKRWKMDVSENAEINPDSFYGGVYYEFDDVIIEHNSYLVLDGGEWIEIGSSAYPFDAFDGLTEEQLIEAINNLN